MDRYFYDSIKPWLISDGSDAALYFDGDFAASPRESVRLGRVRWITIAAAFEHCGIVDYEAGNPVYYTPGMLRAFVVGREAMGKRRRVYTNRHDLPRAQAELEGLEGIEWWVATLDGDTLTADYVPGLWAVQFHGGPGKAVDKSLLYGEW